LYRAGDLWGLACVDAACGEFVVTQLKEDELILELGRLSPSEILVAKRTVKPGLMICTAEVLDVRKGCRGALDSPDAPPCSFNLSRSAKDTSIFWSEDAGRIWLSGYAFSRVGRGCALEYLERTQASQMPKFNGISTYSADGHLVIDANTRRNLELTETSRDRTFDGSLLWTLDKTQTGMGCRMLRKWLLKPLYSVSEIRDRQEALEELISDSRRSKY